MSDRSDGWQVEVVRRLDALVRLEKGWDGYSASPVAIENAIFALRMIEAMTSATTPAPSIVPGTSGDLQVEWHTLNGDIELHVLGPNRVSAWHTFAGFEDDNEILLANDFTEVAEWVRLVTETTIAAPAAAA
jgi:hypothetical protein